MRWLKVHSDCAQQKGKDFNQKAWWDEFLVAGLIPVSLIRWQMTGLDEEIKELWSRSSS